MRSKDVVLPDGLNSSVLCLTVRSAREIGKGDEVAWYADGDSTVRNEFNSDVSYGFG